MTCSVCGERDRKGFMCPSCAHSFDDTVRHDDGSLFVIEWAATRARKFERKRSPLQHCMGCDSPIEKCGPKLWATQRKCCPDCSHEPSAAKSGR